MSENSEHEKAHVVDLPDEIGGKESREYFEKLQGIYRRTTLEGAHKDAQRRSIERRLYEKFCQKFRHQSIDFIGYGHIADEVGDIEVPDEIIAVVDADYIGVRIIEYAGMSYIVHELSDLIRNAETGEWGMKKFLIPFDNFAKFVPRQYELVDDPQAVLLELSYVSEHAHSVVMTEEYTALAEDDKIDVLMSEADCAQKILLGHYSDTLLEIATNRCVVIEMGENGRPIVRPMDQSSIELDERRAITGICKGATYPELLESTPNLDALFSRSPSVRLRVPESSTEYLIPIEDIVHIRPRGFIREDK